MRSDYILYGVAIIFFLLTAGFLMASFEQYQLSIVATTVLALLFVGFGYSQKPKPTIPKHVETVSPIMPAPPQALATTPPSASPAVKETTKNTATESVSQPETPAPTTIGITQVKGIKEKRSQQLKELGINTIQDLANASPERLGKSLQISPKITAKWVEHAKQLAEKS